MQNNKSNRLGKTSAEYEAELDVWKRKAAILEQKLAEHKADHQLVDETKADFLSLVSHQLRTPLTVSLLNIEMLLGGYRGRFGPEQKEALDEIFSSNKKMAQLLNIFSTISKIEMDTFDIRPKLIDLRQMFDMISLDFEDWRKQREVNVRRDYARGLPMVEIDPDLAGLTMRNLLANSIKNTPSGGEVVIGLRNADLGVYITFKDGGEGISPEDRPKIFSKHYRGPHVSKDEWGGSGLDLYIAKTIIDRCGGKIWFESEVGKGTTYYIFLPQKAS